MRPVLVQSLLHLLPLQLDHVVTCMFERSLRQLLFGARYQTQHMFHTALELYSVVNPITHSFGATVS